jgi:hypothetical protein
MADLVRKILGVAIMPVYVALIPLFVTKSLSEDAAPQPELCPVGFLLPHMWMYFLFTYHRQEFFLRFVGCGEAEAKERLEDFWRNVHTADPRRGALFGVLDFASRCIPMGLHGDGVPCTKKDSLDVTSLFGILGVGTTTQLVCYLWAFFSKRKVDELTLLDFPTWLSGITADCGYQVLIWSLRAAELGVHPSRDHRGELFSTEPWLSLAGTTLCGGFFGHIWQFRADADYHYNSLGLAGHWSSRHPCHSCVCNNVAGSPLHNLGFGPDAMWPATIFVVMADFYTQCGVMGKRIHPLLKAVVDGGLGLHVSVFIRDTLHCMNLGSSQAVLGSVLWLLAFGGYVCANPGEASRIIFGVISELYTLERTPTRFTNLELGQFTDPDAPRASYPWLKGKAAETRHLAPIVRVVWELYSRKTDYDNHVSAALETMTEAYSILGVRTDTGQTPQFMTPAASAAFRDVIERFLVHVAFLKQIALAQGPPSNLFHMVSKFHSLWHCGYESQFGHPSTGRTYMNEDYMQHIRAVGMANRHAVAASRRSLTVSERVSLGRSLELFLKDAGGS